MWSQSLNYAFNIVCNKAYLCLFLMGVNIPFLVYKVKCYAMKKLFSLESEEKTRNKNSWMSENKDDFLIFWQI